MPILVHMVDNAYIAARLREMGKYLEIMDENPFKTRSYYVGADTIKKSDKTVEELIRTAQLGRLKGIGPALKDKITTIFETGTCDLLQRLEKGIPEGVREMVKIKGLGPKKIRSIWTEMNITTIGELMYAIHENRLLEAKGFGAKTQESIRKAIEFYLRHQNQFHYSTVEEVAQGVVEFLEKHAGGERVSLIGEVRRKMPTISRIEILAAQSAMESLSNAVEKHPVYTISEKAGTRIVFQHEELAIPIELTFEAQNFPTALLLKTGSEAHLKQFGEVEPKDYKDEAEIFAGKGMQFIPPELREGIGEVDLAVDQSLPKLLEVADLKGVIHSHSTWSDGRHTVKEMAEACIEKGFEYLCLSDHSKSAFYANGLTEGRLEMQHKEVDALNESLAPFRIFKGIESDILNNGDLDYKDEVLASFDFVIASVHSQLKMDEAKATDRLIKAIENPFTTILGHPTGRLLLMRQGYPIDHQRVIDAAAANGVAIEINANPYRLDLDWRWIPYAMEKGVMLCISPDAHSTAGIDDNYWGVTAARKGRLSPEFTLNTRSKDEIEAFFSQKKALATG